MVNEAEAETVRTLFRLYLELKTVKKLFEKTGRLGVAHSGVTYPGQHEAC